MDETITKAARMLNDLYAHMYTAISEMNAALDRRTADRDLAIRQLSDLQQQLDDVRKELSAER